MFRKTKQLSVVDDLVDQIQNAIISGELKPGDRLPSSRDLEETLGASRGALREALRILEQKGLIDVKVGAKGGIFIREANTEPITEGLGLLIRQMKVSLEDLADFRQVIEAGMLRRVMEMCGPEEVLELKKLLPEFERCTHLESGGWVKFLEVEVRVRKLLIRMSKSLMYEVVLVPIHENIFAYADRYLPDADHLVGEAFDDWKFIIEAIDAGDTEAAVLRTQSHIRRFAEHLEDGRRKKFAGSGSGPQLERR